MWQDGMQTEEVDADQLRVGDVVLVGSSAFVVLRVMRRGYRVEVITEHGCPVDYHDTDQVLRVA